MWFMRLLGGCVVLVLVASACTGGDNSASPATLVEAGTATTDASSGGSETGPTPDPAISVEHPPMTVVVDEGVDNGDDPDPGTPTSTGATDNETTTDDNSPSSTAGGTGNQADNPGGDSTREAKTTATETESSDDGAPSRFTTLSPGSTLPSGAQCAAWVRAGNDGIEHRPDNSSANNTVPSSSVTARLVIDGADAARNQRLAPRVDGNFTGTTEQILRWGACKWGFDEDVTRARAVVESSWHMATTGDRTNDGQLCSHIGLSAPCPQSYGLLQVKGTVHEGTHPASARATAFGVDYAMAWLRACFEGGFGWLAQTSDGSSYGAGDEWGCVGAWFSGRWWDQSANDYVGTVRSHLERRTWESYR